MAYFYTKKIEVSITHIQQAAIADVGAHPLNCLHRESTLSFQKAIKMDT